MPAPHLDVICIGRSSVDLYGAQVGGRLEDMATFPKAVGGCPSNIAVGTARLGLKSGLITRVGDEHMGRFIREQCAREGVDVTGVHTDPVRLTSLVLLGIRDEKTFPLIFYRDDCADSALDETDVDPAYVESARAVLVSETHFSRENTAAAQLKAMRVARAARNKIVFDIDYRPNLWGLDASSGSTFRRSMQRSTGPLPSSVTQRRRWLRSGQRSASGGRLESGPKPPPRAKPTGKRPRRGTLRQRTRQCHLTPRCSAR